MYNSLIHVNTIIAKSNFGQRGYLAFPIFLGFHGRVRVESGRVEFWSKRSTLRYSNPDFASVSACGATLYRMNEVIA